MGYSRTREIQVPFLIILLSVCYEIVAAGVGYYLSLLINRLSFLVSGIVCPLSYY